MPGVGSGDGHGPGGAAPDARRPVRAARRLAGSAAPRGAVRRRREGAVYVVAVTIALDTADLDTGIVETFAASLAIALALGLAFGLGGKEYVADNIDDRAARDAGDDGTDRGA